MEEIPIDALPAALRAPVADWLADPERRALVERLASCAPACAAVLPRVLATSGYVADVLARYPELLAELVDSGRLARSLEDGELDRLFAAALDGLDGEPAVEAALRRLRHRELVRVAWRDLGGLAAIPETLRDQTLIADAAIRAALAAATAGLEAIHGRPREADGGPAGFVVIGMGKLGGGELNFSSDVDLVFLYTDQGETDGARPVSNEQYFRRLGQRLVGLLGRNTADGFVYRVDIRLRPFGDSGPVAVSMPAFETYLVRHGRDWERYAYVKARIINDWPGTAQFERDILRPFVYRRYLDFGVFESLRDMKALIETEAERRELFDNVKLGRGGIREIEFIVQALQLVRGGTLAPLRERSLLAALPRLAHHHCLPSEAAAELAEDYLWLRRLENRLQALADRQTHDLPQDPLQRARVALAMDEPDWDALRRRLDAARERVAGHFRRVVFGAVDAPASGDAAAEFGRAFRAGADGTELAAALEGLGVAGDDVATMLVRFRDSSRYQRLDEAGRQRLDALLPSLVAAAGRADSPALALERVMQVVEAIGRRSAYFALLNENPAALERLVGLCGLSDFLTRQVASHPLLLDELLDPRVVDTPPGRGEFAAELAARLAGAGTEDPERRLYAIGNFQQAATFRVAVADLSDRLPIMKVSDRLTDIAELVLEAALQMAWDELTARHGVPRCQDPAPRAARFAIVAYGKLAGLELGYGSDLDVVFVHDSAGEGQQTDGERPLENDVFFARLARRVIHVLTLPTPSGRLYEVDTRLRPSGASGLLVTGLAAFERYQREDAWTWEHQALLRSRAVAGSGELRAAYAAVRRRALTGFVHRETLRDDVRAMRARMRTELAAGTPELFDLKQDEGGVADIEFLVQYLVLRDAAAEPSLIDYPDNIRQLDALAATGGLAPAEAAMLADAYRDYRSRMHRLALAGRSALVPRDEVAEPARRVRALWQRVLG